MFKHIFILFLFLFFGFLKAQNPSTIVFPNPTPNPPNLSVDSYTKAVTKINLLPGFKYGFTSLPSATNLLNLSIGSYPSYVNNNYVDTLSSNNQITINSSLELSTTEGSGNVIPNGSFNYQFPVFCSPGMASTQPNLSIGYNSNSSITNMGLGFSISGLSAISRTNKTVFYDGSNGEIKLNATDVFALDGDRMLLKAGVYGQNGASYKMEVENYSEIVSLGLSGSGPNSFIVTTSDGKTLEYGNSIDSRLNAVNNNEVLAWYLNKVIDEFGNYMTFHYLNQNGEINIERIEYSGNINEGLAPYNKISFEYFDRTDKKVVYYGGGEFNQTKLLNSITCTAANNALVRKYLFKYQYANMSLLSSITEIDANQNQLNPTYIDWTKSAFLTSPTLVGGFVPPSNIKLANGTINSNNISDNLVTLSADMNGDGKKDLISINCKQAFTNAPLPTTYSVFLSTYNPSLLPPNNFVEITNNTLFNSKQLAPNFIEILSTSVFDEDDDNIDEVYITSRTPNTNFYFIQKIKSNGTNYTLSLFQNLTPIISPNSSNPMVVNWRNSGTVYPKSEVSKLARSGYFIGKADFNGDNILDFVNIDQNAISLTPSGGNGVVTFPISDVIKSKLGDFNGDGNVDIYLLKANGINCFFNNFVLNSFEVQVISFSSALNSFNIIANKTITNGIQQTVSNCSQFDLITFFENGSNNIDFGDFNGDGKTDILFNSFTTPFTQNINPGSANLRVSLCTGINFANDQLIQNIATKISGFNAAFFASDLNNDGFCDWGSSAFDNAGNKTLFSYYSSNGNITHPTPTTYSKLLKFAGCMGDFDGDGTQDYIGQQDLNILCTIEYNVFKHNNKRLLKRIYNIKTDLIVDYSLLVNNKSNTNYPLYTKTNSTNSNSFSITKMPLFVAISTKFNNIETKYAYENALFHRSLKGYLGFEKFYTLNVNTNLLTVSSYTYNNTFDYLSNTENISGYAQTPSNNFIAINTNSISTKSNVVLSYGTTGNTRYLFQTFTNSKDYLKATNSFNTTLYDNSKKGNILSTQSYNLPWNNSFPVLNGITQVPAYIGILNPFTNKTIYKIQTLTLDKTVTNSNGAVISTYITNYNYDAAGHMISKIENSNLPGNDITTSFQNFNNFGSPKQITITSPDLPLPRTNQLFYDNTGRFVIKTINPIGSIEEAIYETKYGNKIQTKDITGLISTFNYDGLGRLIKTTTPNNAINTLKYEWHIYTLPNNPTANYYGGMVTTKVEGGSTFIKKFDRNELLLESNQEIFGGANKIIQYVYNNNNQLISETELASINPVSGNKILLYTYDNFLRQRNVTQKIGNNILSNIDYTYNNIAKDNAYIKGYVQVKAPNSNNGEFYFVKKENDEAGRNDRTLNFTNLPNTTHLSQTKFNQHGLPILITNSFNNALSASIQINYDVLGRQQQLIDPSAGISSYVYNNIGELTQQTSPNGTYNFTYDEIGRVISKNGGTNNYTYQYVTNGNGKQQLKKVIGPNEITEYDFDNLNRVIEKKQTITSANNKILKSNYTYDKYGNMINYTYPSGFVTTNEYDNLSNLIKIKNNNTILWELNTIYTPNLINQYTTGNGLFTNNISYDLNQNLQQKTFANIQQQNYNIAPKNGDLLNRDLINLLNNNSNNEQFKYDEFNRLTTTKYLDNSNTLQNKASVSYFDNGNINNKSDAGDYVYGQSSNPYQLTQINNATNNTSLYTLNVSYNNFKKVSQITEATTNKQFDFVYGNNEERIKMDYLLNSNLQYSRYYTDNYDLQENANNTFKEWNYVYAPTGLAAIYYNNNGTGQLLYTQTDHLGSPVLVANSNGVVLEQYSFDAWGRRRNPADWNDYSTGINSNFMIRGFTMHEHLDEVNIINMNGRIYDPVLGRFLQTDNYVQSPGDLQNFNRYSYVLNNPLKYTDPTGNYALIDDILAAAIGGIVNVVANWQYLDNGGGFWNTLGRGSSAFAAGAVAGWTALYPEFGGWLIGGATVGATNSWLRQTSVPGADFDYAALAYDAAVGAVGSAAGGAIGGVVGPAFASINGISNPILASTLGGALTGGVTGATTGFLLTFALTGDLQQSLYAAGTGGITGFVAGAVGGYVNAKYSQSKKAPLSPDEFENLGQPEKHESTGSKTTGEINTENNADIAVDGGSQSIKLENRMQVDKFVYHDKKVEMVISNMSRSDVMSKCTDFTPSTKTPNLYNGPNGATIMLYESSYNYGGGKPTLQYNNGRGNIRYFTFTKP